MTMSHWKRIMNEDAFIINTKNAQKYQKNFFSGNPDEA